MPSEAMPDLNPILSRMWMTAEQVGQKDYETIKKAVTSAGVFAVNKGASLALGSLGPITMAVGAWVSAAQVASRISSNMAFWDMMPTSKKGGGLYQCSCGNCDESVQFLVSQQETKVIKIAASMTVVGAVPVLAHTGYQAVKGKNSAKRTETAQRLRQAALPIARKRKIRTAHGFEDVFQVVKPGCRKAQALIATLFGEHTVNPIDYKKTLAAIVAIDGWVPIKSEID